MQQVSYQKLIIYAAVLSCFFFGIAVAHAGPSIATTTLLISSCGNDIVEAPEQCDVSGETGTYSTTIAGRQCNAQCLWGPYCGDGILQTVHDEECDDGNNNDADFCASDCTIEPAGSGGGGSSGGGSAGGGGSTTDLGDTSISVEGVAYPNRTVNIILDADSVGTVRADSRGNFDFAIDADPGAATMGFWSTDTNGTRSITFNTTFDVTQGAVTTVRGILLPPTLRANATEINPGDTVTFSGQAAPNVTVELYIDDSIVESTTANASGQWEITYTTTGLSAAEHLAKARFISGTGSLTSQSSFSTAITLFVGVEGRSTTPSDLNRDGEVDLIDFSILIFWWQTAGGNSNPPADINGNGNVGIEDFSILLFNWTG